MKKMGRPGRPVIAGRKKKSYVTLTIAPEDLAEIDEFCQKNKMSRGQIVQMLWQHYSRVPKEEEWDETQLK